MYVGPKLHRTAIPTVKPRQPSSICNIQWDGLARLQKGQAHVPLDTVQFSPRNMRAQLGPVLIGAHRAQSTGLVLPADPAYARDAALPDALVQAATALEAEMPITLLGRKQEVLMQWRPDSHLEGDSYGQLVFPTLLKDMSEQVKSLRRFINGGVSDVLREVPWIVHVHGAVPPRGARRAARLVEEVRSMLGACAEAGIAYAAVTNPDEHYVLGEYDHEVTYVNPQLEALAARAKDSVVRPRTRSGATRRALPRSGLASALHHYYIAPSFARTIEAGLQRFVSEGLLGRLPTVFRNVTGELRRPHISRDHLPLSVATLLAGRSFSSSRGGSDIDLIRESWGMVYDWAAMDAVDLQQVLGLRKPVRGIVQDGARGVERTMITRGLDILFLVMYQRPEAASHFSYILQRARQVRDDKLAFVRDRLRRDVMLGQIVDQSALTPDEWERVIESKELFALMRHLGIQFGSAR